MSFNRTQPKVVWSEMIFLDQRLLHFVDTRPGFHVPTFPSSHTTPSHSLPSPPPDSLSSPSLLDSPTPNSHILCNLLNPHIPPILLNPPHLPPHFSIHSTPHSLVPPLPPLLRLPLLPHSLTSPTPLIPPLLNPPPEDPRQGPVSTVLVRRPTTPGTRVTRPLRRTELGTPLGLQYLPWTSPFRLV